MQNQWVTDVRRDLPAPRRSALVEREAHRAAIAEVVSGVVAGSGGALVFVGGPGVGKSSLLECGAETADSNGVRVLKTHAVRSESDLPYAGLHLLLHPLLDHASALPATQRDVLLSGFGQGPGTAERFRIALATLDLLSEAAAAQPILLTVDDAHWLDEPSADVLAFVARRLSAEPIGIIAAIRDEIGAALGGLPRMPVAPLSAPCAEALLAKAYPDLSAEVRTWLLQVAQGNPLALWELPKSVPIPTESPAPPGFVTPLTTVLESSYGDRMSVLPSETRMLLTALAVDESASVAEVLAAAAALHSGEIGIAALQPAVDARLIEITDGRPHFTHPLIGSAVYQAARIDERRTAHIAMATVVGRGTNRGVWQRAAAAIGTDDALADELSDLADGAVARGAPAVAVAALGRSADLCSAPGTAAYRLLAAAECAIAIGRARQALAWLERADATHWGLDEQVRAAVVEELADAAPLSDPYRLPKILALTGRLHQAGSDAAAIGLLWNRSWKYWMGGAGDVERRAVLAAAEELDLPAEHPQFRAVRACLAPADARNHRPSPEVSGDADDFAELSWRAVTEFFRGSYPQALDDLSGAIVVARSHARLALVTRLGLAAAQAAIWAGRLQTAAAACEEAERGAYDIGLSSWAMAAHVTGAIVKGLYGDYSLARDAVDQAERDAEYTFEPYLMADWQHGLAVAALAIGEFSTAQAHLSRIVNPRDRACHYGIRLRIAGDLAEAVAAVEGRDMARNIVAPLLDEIEDLDSPVTRIAALHADVVTAAPHKAGEVFETALACDLTAWPLAAARLQLAYGHWLRSNRRSVQARVPLRAARDAFDALGTRGWAKRARQELAATGEFSDAGKVPKWSTLTPQEWQIASMAAAGLTNRQIGQQLFLSHRTVGSHLYHLFPKLGVTTRNKLAEALAEMAEYGPG